MNKIKALLIILPCLILTALIIIAIPDKHTYKSDETGYLLESDEPEYVTNSDMAFFTDSEQVTTETLVNTADTPTYFTISNSIVSTDYTKNDISVVPNIGTTYTGSKKLVVYNGEVVEYEKKTRENVILKGGTSVPVGETFDIILSDGLLGSRDRIPHRIERLNTYYAAFTSEREVMYFEFTSQNEFVSVWIENLSTPIEYTLLDSNMNPLKNGTNNLNECIEIQFKGTGSAKYYLKIKGSYSDSIKPFSVRLPNDNNEWLWQMKYSGMGVENTGSFDYYGDEDFFVLPSAVTSNINKSVIKFSNASTPLNVVIYDKTGRIIKTHIYKPGETEYISMYGLDGAHVLSLYSVDGSYAGSSYEFKFENIDVDILTISTYGFELSPSFSENVDYYTSSVSSLEGKMITDVLYTFSGDLDIKISVTSQKTGKTQSVKLNKEIPLEKGRNTITVTLSNDTFSKEVTIIISDKTYDLSLTDFKYTEATMPESYKAQIEALRKAHPNWKFTFVKTGYDFNKYVNSQLGEASILNGKQATAEQIAYYVDPRNFLTEKSVFMFEKQIYNEGVYSTQGVESVWNKGSYASDEPYTSYIMEAAESTGLSPYFIVARAALESGRGTSALSTGTVSGYEGYYNFYGIGANDSNPLIGGASYAKSQNWNSKRRAIIEGAAWVKSQYIAKAQFTIYFMKYCFIPNLGWHQYMTDIAAPSKDAVNYYNAHAAGGTLECDIEFVIPVFDNMP